jgi:hypothetical protein
MKNLIFVCLLFTLLFSCEQDNNTPVLAGIIDNNMFYQEFNPPLQCTMQTDSTTNSVSGTSSIDINSDGLYDLIFHVKRPISWDEKNNVEYGTYHNILELNNNLEVVSFKETYYIGLGQTSEKIWVDALSYEDKIEADNDWSGSNRQIYMWALPTPSTMSNGVWYGGADSERYLGIRIASDLGHKYGWIKINPTADNDFTILSFAIEN